MATIVPRLLKAGRDLVIDGVPVAAGATLTAGQIASVRHLDALLSKRMIIPVPDPHYRKTSERVPTATSLSSGAVKQLLEGTAGDMTLNVDQPFSGAGLRLEVTVVDGQPPFNIEWGDMSSTNIKGRKGSHTYSGTAELTITATGENGDTTTASGLVGDFRPTVGPTGASYVDTGLSVDFTSGAANGPDTYFWDFGDGETSTVQDPTHVYAIDGEYQVVFTSSNQWGTALHPWTEAVVVVAL